MSSDLPNPEFTVVQTHEPHRARRARILREQPELRRLFGHDARTAAVTVAVVVAHLAIAVALQFATAGQSVSARLLWAAGAALAVGAILSHWLAMSIHEATHNLAARTVDQNVALSFFANVPMVLPVAMSFRRYHLAHHARLGTLGEDTDLPHALEVRFIGNSAPRKLLWWTFYALVYLGRSATFAKRPNRLELLNLAFMVAVDAALLAAVGPTALAYLALSTVFAHGLHPVAAHFLHEHYVFSPGQETYSYYGPLNHVTFNVGYHNEHHDLPNVAGWRLPELRALALPHYAPLASHTSWTAVLWRFVTDPSLGFGSRLVRAAPGRSEAIRASPPAGTPSASRPAAA